MLPVAAFFTLFLFLMDCNSKKKDDSSNLLLALLGIAAGGSNAEFKLTTATAMAGARVSNSSGFLVGPNASGFLIDLAGDNPLNYGDGDAFSDHFLTPAAVSMEVCQILAYKKVAKGGPAPGTETIENADFRPFKLGNNNVPGGAPDLGPCSGFMSVALKVGEGTTGSAYLPISPIPSEVSADYDRIGIIVRGFSYYFEPNVVPENSYRYVDLLLNNPSPQMSRGEVSTKIFGNGCPVSFTNSAGFILNQLLPAGETLMSSCTFVESAVDSSSGSFLAIPGFNYFSYPGAFLNTPVNPGVNYTSANQKLKFKSPASMNGIPATTPYILVVDLDNSNPGKSNLLFNLSVENVLFWDSSSADNVFSPQLDAADRPNATDGNDNLTNAARRNVIFHLPTILSEYK
ncbi:hypothetical protein A0128_03575 [Leptospira tipperaryensis]|uniref:Lipoprotein n=1 Tax=Leptospira tipperaryensis TaxID=2564040 RepID=A0A1D7V209_9LEPT|nr:hypothetical protein [Leptospira tipperaryensis]AOP35880.1 hypothetical protein A0128_03575 [Leptospira tipperaryensis]